MIVLLATTLLAALLLFGAYALHPCLGLLVETIMTYQILAVKCLKVESMKVYHCLKEQGLEEARGAVSMIVGRDTAQLDAEGVTKAAVETVAENTSDGIIAPMLYMLRGEITTRLKNFVEAGGILFLTYWSGVVDQDDLCYLGGRPYGMRDLVGFRSEEIDGLYDGMENSGVKVKAENLSEREERILSKMKESYRIDRLAEIEKIEGADVLYTYGSDFYEGRAVLSSHRVGQGYVYGIAAALEQDFCTDLVRAVLEEEGVTSLLGEGHKLPDEVTVNSRTGDDGSVYIFLQNWKDEEQELHLPADCSVILGRDDGKIDALGNLVLKKTLAGIESNHCI